MTQILAFIIAVALPAVLPQMHTPLARAAGATAVDSAPALSYSGYLGGSDIDNSPSVAIDSVGNMYVLVQSRSPDFPIATVEPYKGGNDVIVTKLAPNGTVLYNTRLGGKQNESAWSIVVDTAGNAYLTGITRSDDFPVRNAFQQTKKEGADAFVTKLDPNGGIVFSTFIGGNGSDEGHALAVNSRGDVFVAGDTSSTNFPIARAFDNVSRGGDAFLVKLYSSGSAIEYSTYLGGDAGSEIAFALALDSANNVYIAGETTSDDFQTKNAIVTNLPSKQGSIFVSKVNAEGSGLVYSTFFGGLNGDQSATDLAVGLDGSVYVAGWTTSREFQVTQAAQSKPGANACVAAPCQDAVVFKLSSSGRELVYSTYLGGGDNDQALEIAVDGTGTAYVTGNPRSPDFPLADAAQKARGGGATLCGTTTVQPCSDAFVTKIDPTGARFVYSSYFGGSGEDLGRAIAIGPNSVAISGNTTSNDLPGAVPGVRGQDAFVMRMNDSSIVIITPTATATPTPGGPTPTTDPFVTPSPTTTATTTPPPGATATHHTSRWTTRRSTGLPADGGAVKG
jgi:hypothetical protein